MSQPPKGDVIGYVTSVLQPGDVCIDGGANTGTVTEAMARAVGSSGRVYAIEPDSRCQNALAGLAERYGCVRPVFVALDSHSRLSTLMLGQQTQQSSLIPAAVEGNYGIDSVITMPLDLVSRPDVVLVKLDLQGGEWAALQGATRLLRTCNRWVLEVWPRVLEAQDVTPQRFWQFFEDAGLTLRWMHPRHPCTRETFTAWWVEAKQFVNMIAER